MNEQVTVLPLTVPELLECCTEVLSTGTVLTSPGGRPGHGTVSRKPELLPYAHWGHEGTVHCLELMCDQFLISSTVCYLLTPSACRNYRPLLKHFHSSYFHQRTKKDFLWLFFLWGNYLLLLSPIRNICVRIPGNLHKLLVKEKNMNHEAEESTWISTRE